MNNIISAAIVSAVLLGMSISAGAADPKGEFVGSLKCRKCHLEEYKSWKDTWHSKIARPRKGAILKEAVASWTGDGINPGPTTGNVTGKTFSIDDVQFVIGSRWKQRYLVKDEQSGGLQFLNMQFNRYSGKWEKYGNRNDWNNRSYRNNGRDWSDWNDRYYRSDRNNWRDRSDWNNWNNGNHRNNWYF